MEARIHRAPYGGPQGDPPRHRAGSQNAIAPAVAGQGDGNQDRLGSQSKAGNRAPAATAQADKPLISKHGTRHSLAVLVNWSESARRALGIHRDGGGAP